MKQNKGLSGIYTGIAITALGLLAMALPPALGADMMAWGYGTMALGFFAFILGGVTLLLFLRRRSVLRRMLEGREVLARWTYDAQTWRKAQRDEVRSNRGMPVFGAILGGVFVLIGLVFYLTDPDEMGLMLAIMAGVGLLVAGAAWLSAAMRNRAVLGDPGEVVVARGGVYYMGFLTDWNNMTSWFDEARLVRKGDRAALVIRYRQLAGRPARIQKGSLSIPVPQGREADAEEAARKLNAQPY